MRDANISEERYRHIVEDFTGFIVRWSPGGRRTFISDSYCQYFGITREEAQTVDFLQLIYPPDRARVLARVRALSASHPVSVGEHRVVHADGSVRWMEWTDRALLDEDGAIREYQSIGYDIDERKRSAELLRKAKRAAEAASRAKSQFLATMSHEIRTPLNCVVGYADLLQTTELSEMQRQFVKQIISSSGHLVTLLNDILDLARTESQGLSVETKLVDVNELVETVVRISRLEAERKGIGLEYRGGPPRHLLTDPKRLQQVVLNLLNNAIKFTPRGSVVVSLEENKQARQLELSVRDTGIGIAREEQAKIFDSFYQVDMSSTKNYEGTGLGLCLVKRIVSALGGAVRVNSEPGRGSEFVVSLPMKECS